MATNTLTYTGELVVTSCWCGIRLAIPSALYRKMQADSRQDAYCPLGHTFIYRKNATDRERERREAAEQYATHLRDQLEAERRQHAATKGQLTKTKKRAAAALCPVQGCGRSFVQLQRHLATKHPGFDHGH